MVTDLILSLRLDFVGFVAVTLAAGALSQWWIQRRYPSASLPAWMWIASMVLLAASFAAGEWAGMIEHRRLRGMFEGMAPTYADELARAGHDKLSFDTPPDDPLYLQLIQMQKRWLQNNPLVADIYTVARRADGRFAFLVDSETDYDGDGKFTGERESRTPIGESFADDDDKLAAAFSGKASFDPEPYTDRWGTWVSSYFPIRNADGQVTAVLGVDYRAADWNAAVLRARGAVLGFSGLLAAVMLGSAVNLTITRQEMIRRAAIEKALRESEASFRQLALHDRLTNLPNRALLHDRLTQAVLRAQRHPGYKFALMFLDLDRFKLINDGLGHAAGDLLLRTVADRLRAVLRDGDTIARIEVQQGYDSACSFAARLGGDEFVVLLDSITRDEDVQIVASRILRALSEPFMLNGQAIHPGVSIGIALSDPRYDSGEQMLRDADTAMYHAKSQGRGRHAIFHPVMHERVVERLTIESELRQAIALRQLSLEFQPIISLSDRRLRGFEALARWNHPVRGRVSPELFIPMAEETGLIVPLGQWALEHACQTLAQWKQQMPRHAESLTMNVNVSRRQFDSAGFVQHIASVLERTALPPSALKIEITESLIAHDPLATARVVAQLKAMGVGLVIDDFGTGSSSLGNLHSYPLEGLKIDRSFISHASLRRDYAAVINSIVDLARNLGMTVVAEGVETREQSVLLQALGCELAQGFLFARPLPAGDAAAFIAAHALPAASAAA